MSKGDSPFADFFNNLKSSESAKETPATDQKEKKTVISETASETIDMEDTQIQSLATDVQWRKELALAIDEEEATQSMHRIAAEANKKRVRLTQIRQLENVAYSVQNWSEILNFIYRQISKHGDWQGWGHDLEKALRDHVEKAKGICSRHWPQEDLNARLKVQESTLILFQGMISHLSARFAYENKARG